VDITITSAGSSLPDHSWRPKARVRCAKRQPKLEPEASHLVLDELTWWLYEPVLNLLR
jgi:hypothetical protein